MEKGETIPEKQGLGNFMSKLCWQALIACANHIRSCTVALEERKCGWTILLYLKLIDT